MSIQVNVPHTLIDAKTAAATSDGVFVPAGHVASIISSGFNSADNDDTKAVDLQVSADGRQWDDYYIDPAFDGTAIKASQYYQYMGVVRVEGPLHVRADKASTTGAVTTKVLMGCIR